MSANYSRVKPGGSVEMPSQKIDFDTWVNTVLHLSKSASAMVRLQNSISIQSGWGPKYEQRLEKSFQEMADFQNKSAAHIRTEDPIPLSLPDDRESIRYKSREIFAVTSSGDTVNVIVNNDGSSPTVTYTSSEGNTYVGNTSQTDLSIGSPFQMTYRDQDTDKVLHISELIAMAKQDNVLMNLKLTSELQEPPKPKRELGFPIKAS
jgi:hypothetical protein